MARTSTRRWKGCQLCKPHKHAAEGQARRKSVQELRRLGRSRRISRHDLGDHDVLRLSPRPAVSPGSNPRPNMPSDFAASAGRHQRGSTWIFAIPSRTRPSAPS
jgi:hypothetical protein